MSESLTSQEHGWKMKMDQKEWKNDIKIKIWAKKSKEGQNDLFRFECKSRGQPIEKLWNFFKDPPIEKIPMMTDKKVVDKKDEGILDS